MKKQAEEEKNSKLIHGVDDKSLYPQFFDVINFKINTGVEQCLKEEEQNYKTENEGMYEKIEHCEDNNFIIDKGAFVSKKACLKAVALSTFLFYGKRYIEHSTTIREE